jgi:hypothetical protein
VTSSADTAPARRRCARWSAPSAKATVPTTNAVHACTPGRRRPKPSTTPTATASGTAIVARFAPKVVPAGGVRTASVSRWPTIGIVARAQVRAACERRKDMPAA